MDQHQHSITSDITAQRQTLRTADTAPDREWRENSKASVFLTTDTDRVTILFTTITAVASITPSGLLQVECDRATIDAIRSDWDVVGWKS